VVGEDQLISLDHLYLKYRAWCEGEGRTKDSTTKEIFSRDLRQKFDGIRFDRKQVNGKRMQMITGIGSDAV
jgi:hypothetical protein